MTTSETLKIGDRVIATTITAPDAKRTGKIVNATNSAKGVWVEIEDTEGKRFKTRPARVEKL